MNDDLLDAAMQDNTRDAQTALSGKADPNAPHDMYDLTPLHYAAHHNNAEIVNMLLGSDHPANVFSQDMDGRLPIHRAVLLGHADVLPCAKLKYQRNYGVTFVVLCCIGILWFARFSF